MYQQVERSKEHKSRAVSHANLRARSIIKPFRYPKNPADKDQLKDTILQGRFTGRLGGLLRALSPVKVGATNTYYNNLWHALNDSQTNIGVENAGRMANFDPTSDTLHLKGQMLIELMGLQTGKTLDSKALADHIALITHELSHAHDSVVLGKELKGEKGTDDKLVRIRNVMMTEVQAWEREARTRERLLPAGEDDSLWLAWFDLEANMLTSRQALKANMKNNEVVNRYYRYLLRELKGAYHPVEANELNGCFNRWFTAYGPAVSNEMMRLSRALIAARNTI